MTTFVHHPSETEPKSSTVNAATVNGAARPLTAPTPPGAARATAGAAVPGVDAQLQKAVRQSGHLRRGFYVVVLLVALAGQVTGAVQALHIPLMAAIPAVAALELGGVVVLANADVRRRLGERALGSRVLSAAIAAGAVTFNWLAHTNHLAGGFFAGMSLLGYLVWATHAENSRRDRLRALGDLPPTTPAYEIVGHWLAHPWLTRRARSLAKVDPTLGLYGSLTAAREQLRAERRRAAISTVLHRKIRAAVDPVTADIAVHVYDLDHIADRLADQADYDGLTALISDDLTPARLAAVPAAPRRRPRPWWRRARTGAEIPAVPAAAEPAPPFADPHAVPVTLPPAAGTPARAAAPAAASNVRAPGADAPAAASPVLLHPEQASAVLRTPPDADPHLTEPQPPQPLPAPHHPSAITAQHLRLVRTDAGPAPDAAIGGHPWQPAAGAGAANAWFARTPLAGGLPGGTTQFAEPADAADGVAAVRTEDVERSDDRHDGDARNGEGGGPNDPGDELGGEDGGGDEDGTDGDSVPQETAAAVAYWHQREPGLHPRDIGARIGRSERTVRRYLPPTADPQPDR
ncbi:hypothetical protein Dvina_51415 [Dactylosporangium vinaceum]|uniref:DUF2637 domain-containing protein n=1 Tax=Dactylosporangium vinaceum TaxID=53362 RepID=A0ABV5M2K3_9ACTN|nr:hypothetical protein [Dactylosporangium vinaceum]UAB96257.1 hypothetical protein Dvina_51415 [Dactylosporangium vinaceum]